MSIGRNGSTYLTAMIDEFMVRKGGGGHTSGFTPETAPYTLSGAVYSAWQFDDMTGEELTGSVDLSATYGSVGALVTVTNNSVYSGYLTSLKIYSYVVQSDTPITDIQESAASITEYGYQNDSIDMQYQQNTAAGSAEGRRVVELDKTPRTELKKITLSANKSDLYMYAFQRVDIGDLVSVAEDQSGMDAWYYVQGVEYSITPAPEGMVNIMYSWNLQRSYSLLNGLELMAIDFNSVGTTDAVDFGAVPYINGRSDKSLSFWLYIETGAAIAHVISFDGITYAIHHSTKYVYVVQKYTVNNGEWKTPDNSLTTGAWNHIVVTKSGDADPIAFINGVSSTVSDVVGLSGTAVYDGNGVRVGNSYAGTSQFKGKVKDLRVYDGILSGATALSIYNDGAGGTANPTNLLFQAFAVRSEDVTAYTNLTLTSEDGLLDAHLGHACTPTGSPISRTI